MINLDKVTTVLADCAALVAELDGAEHTDPALAPGSRREQTRVEKEERVLRSKSLMLLADRLELAAALVRNEYWFARGELDPLNPDRED